jgi:indole-3-glycerol phosphate synthase
MAASQKRDASPALPSLTSALQGGDIALVAEIKRRSPSRGGLNEGMSAADRARDYATGGARALSVLTEPDEFGGSVADLVQASERTGLPVVKKDFHVDPMQVWEAKAVGASALLLIARGLGWHRLADMMAATRVAGIEAVVEVRNDGELQWALDSGAAIIGVNCRDLESLMVELSVHERVIPRIPAHCIAVAESGIVTRMDVERLAVLGTDAILVGSSLSRASDPVATAASLTGVGRRRRGS